jgi:hypothetical protein
MQSHRAIEFMRPQEIQAELRAASGRPYRDLKATECGGSNSGSAWTRSSRLAPAI